MSSPSAAAAGDAGALASELTRYRLLDPARLTDALAEFPGGGPGALAEFLRDRGLLTSFQAERALGGKAPPLALGPYRLTGPAGPGVFGPVFAATHTERGGQYHVGVFPLRSLWRARQAKQLARRLAAVAHPGVVPLIDADSANGFHYLVWPHAPGQSLAERVAAGTIPPENLAGLLAQLAESLHACHARQAVHGTITPRSIVLNPGQVPRLLELGAGAILAENLTDDESLLDTLSTAVGVAGVMEYASPEFVADPTVLTPTGDQYALGAVGYFALTGRPPVPLPDRLGTRQDRLPRPLCELNPAVPPELAAVIERMLRPDPAARFPCLDEVQDRLAALAGQWHQLPPPPAGSIPEPPRSEARQAWSAARPAARDDSESSVNFELPDPGPDLSPVELPSPSGPMGRSRRAGFEHPEPRSLPLFPPALGSASSPTPRTSPQSEVLHMAKLVHPDPFPGRNGSVPPPDPHAKVAPPVQYHTPTAEPDGPLAEEIEPDERPVLPSALWRRVRRNLLFWQAVRDVVQVSVFGPATVAPGQSAKLAISLHTPEVSDSIRTLSRAFHHDAELIGTGYIAQEVRRGTTLAVHIALVNAGVSKSMMTVVWRGQPQRLVFDLHVPWESPGGPASGLVSVGRDDVRIGKIEFRLMLLPRK